MHLASERFEAVGNDQRNAMTRRSGHGSIMTQDPNSERSEESTEQQRSEFGGYPLTLSITAETLAMAAAETSELPAAMISSLFFAPSQIPMPTPSATATIG